MDASRWLFLVIILALGYLVLPPLFFILYTSLVAERGAAAGSFTLNHFANLVASLSAVRTLLWNSLVFAFGSAAGALALGTLLAWLAERSNAPFRSLAYV